MQADPHGLFCEFCNTQREIISSPPMAAPPVAQEAAPSYYTKLSSHEDFAAVWGTGSNSSRAAVPLWSEIDRQQKDQPPVTAGQPAASASSSSSTSSEARGSVGSVAERVHMAGATKGMLWEVAGRSGDWYMLAKLTGTDRQLGDKWETLHRGWVGE